MYTQRLNIQQLENPPEPFDGVRAYAQTKRAMVYLSERLATALGPDNIAVHCMHPGWADTPGVERSLPLFWKVTRSILRNAEAGADTIVWLAGCDRAHSQSGLFWFDRVARSTHLLPGTRVGPEALDELWTRTHQWAGVPPTVWNAS